MFFFFSYVFYLHLFIYYLFVYLLINLIIYFIVLLIILFDYIYLFIYLFSDSDSLIYVTICFDLVRTCLVNICVCIYSHVYKLLCIYRM